MKRQPLQPLPLKKLAPYRGKRKAVRCEVNERPINRPINRPATEIKGITNFPGAGTIQYLRINQPATEINGITCGKTSITVVGLDTYGKEVAWERLHGDEANVNCLADHAARTWKASGLEVRTVCESTT